ncbi:MAG: 16S rRNA (uracil(1498)-N(3))-methyltransferase [Syntrophaceae bacterium]|nr:16S rRNA (uracil(1498)-N(3))-methyltransferase [Syntrophaceae bacterium]
MADRIVLDQKVVIGKEVIIEGPPLEALRFQGGRIGSILTLTDSEGKDFRGRVLRLSGVKASVLIFDTFSSSTESLLEIILLQALPEKERMEWIIQKATELGVAAIIPFKSERSISLEERESKQKKAHRWQEIAIKAVQQSRRAKVPKIEPYRSFIESLEFCKEDALKILLWEKEGESLKVVFKRFSALYPPFEKRLCRQGGNKEKCHAELVSASNRIKCLRDPEPSSGRQKGVYDTVSKGGEGEFEIYPPTKVYIMVGPEGGFTGEEVKLAKQKGFIPVKLGQRILRTETAAITLIGILQYELGDLG